MSSGGLAMRPRSEPATCMMRYGRPPRVDKTTAGLPYESSMTSPCLKVSCVRILVCPSHSPCSPCYDLYITQHTLCLLDRAPSRRCAAAHASRLACGYDSLLT